MTTSSRARLGITTEEGGRQNMFGSEPPIEVMEGYDYWKNAELINGRLAMIGFAAAVINYGLFGWIVPGIV